MSADLLQTVVAAARRAAELRARAADSPPEAARFARELADAAPRGKAFVESLQAPGIRVIAECKRRSPSRGVLRRDYDVASIARGYERAGAAALSVLTEPTFFDGSLDDLRRVRQAVLLPILRKDFIVSEFQVLEARAAGADAILLIVAALSDADLRALIESAGAAGMAALVEVHDRVELDRALAAGASVIGVNSRDLRTLQVDISVFDHLSTCLPRGTTAVAESGLRSPDDLGRLHALRYDAFLIGERLMTEPDPGTALASLRLAAEGVAPR